MPRKRRSRLDIRGRFSTKNAWSKHRLIRAVAEALEQRTLLSAFVVNTLADPSTPTAGTLSLREAIADANSAPGDNTITFAGGLTGTITLTQGVLELSNTTGTTTITGPGAGVLAVDGNNASTVFLIDSAVTAAFSGLSIIDGNSGLTSGGGIINDGTLTLTDSTVSGDSATGQNGGGIYNQGALYVSNTTISNNAADYGAGICEDGTTLTLTNCTFSNNAAQGDGGGLFVSGTDTVSNCTFLDNSATNVGGGIEVYGTLTATGSTFSGNSANDGGALGNSGNVILNNSTISGNSTISFGGGITNYNVMYITNATISGNSGAGGGIYNGGGTLTLANTIITGNTSSGSPSNLGSGATLSGSNNLIGSGSSGGLTNGVNGNIVLTDDADALLGTLQDNGGPTQTIALLAGSPAIGAGSNSLATAAGITTDQRGDPLNSPADIGAFSLVSSNVQYVTQLYEDILNRVPDSPGQAYWAGLLNSGASRQSVALGFTGSLEYYDDLVESDYQAYQGRAPDVSELANSVDQFLAGQSAEAVQAQIVGSQEYFNDSGATPDGYITKLYTDLFGRAPDMTGQTNWEAVLAGPGGMSAVASGFVYSAEIFNDKVSGWYETYLQRSATSGEIADGQGELIAGDTDMALVANLVTLPEYLSLHNIA